MAKLPVLTYPDPVLAKKAEPVGEITPELTTLIEDMIQTMYESDGVGLAAPQVGHSIRLITIDETGPKERQAPMVFINPERVAGEGDSRERGVLPEPSDLLLQGQTVRYRDRAWHEREGRSG